MPLNWVCLLRYGQVDYFSGADLHGITHNDANAVYKERYVIMQKTVKPVTVVVGLTSTLFPRMQILLLLHLTLAHSWDLWQASPHLIRWQEEEQVPTVRWGWYNAEEGRVEGSAPVGWADGGTSPRSGSSREKKLVSWNYARIVVKKLV